MSATRGMPSRRTVLRAGLAGMAVVGTGGSVILLSATRVAADVVNATLFVAHGVRVMIDGLVVPFVGFGSTADRLELPSGQLEGQTGDTVNVTITNNSTLPVGFFVQAAPVSPASTRHRYLPGALARLPSRHRLARAR